MAILESIIAGLNPDVEKRQKGFILKDLNRSDYYIESNECKQITQLFIDNQHISSVEENLKTEIINISKLPDNWNGLGTKKISADVINNTINIINEIPPSILTYLNANNIYPSKYGTIILDWEFGSKGNIFSLEIAKNSVGYFVEKEGVDIKQIESIEIINDHLNDAVTQITGDLVNYFL